MNHSDYITTKLESCFRTIYEERMKGLPIVNDELEVEAIGFLSWNGHEVGVLITPWFMNLVMLPMEGDEWEALPLDSKREFDFPARKVIFVLTEVEGIGRCMSSPIYSPMNGFPDHRSAVGTASAYLRDLMDESLQVETDIEEERLQRFLDGGEMVNDHEADDAETEAVPLSEKIEQPVSRRDLLRGLFS
ncbi:[NiFe]-hydrogenase assembly chaperone HybE [Solemya velesiana gill symbiont]|uniref:[NiFe]-hydrogenase assembly chaperone HybE n=1 Tax=Solemya velesiana gill symbiont TaxID=1918948 RepID=UPI0009983E5A|nr:[NiFe]-hydrogenase assembly chaperone HybE [Solemya velesiana gill symbiont]